MGLIRLTDKDLVHRVTRGDHEAFNLLVARWERKLFNYAYRLTGNREDALDICQDTFTRAYEQILQLKEAEKFSFWLFKIARNFSISFYRRERNRPKSASADDPENDLDLENLLASTPRVRIDGGHGFEHDELRLIVEKALDQLPFEQRETIVLKVFEGLKFSEIAEISECPVSTVKSRLYLGMNLLRRILSRN